MYTVVIPTLWIPDSTKFKGLIEESVENSLVSKVIIIDNDPKVDESLKVFILGNNPKIVHLRMKKNNYVNPAWNLGVSNSETPYVILLNDDFFTDKGISSLIKVHFSHPSREVGIYGINEQCYSNYHGKESIEEMEDFSDEVTIVDGGFSLGWGCCIILPTKKYRKIPNNLKIWFGVNFLLCSWKSRKLPTFNFKNIKASRWSTTINSNPTELNLIMEKDREHCDKLPYK